MKKLFNYKILKLVMISLGWSSLIFSFSILSACSESNKTAGTSTTAENGIHGVAKQRNGQFAQKNSEVQLKRTASEDGLPSYDEVTRSQVQDKGKFYLAPPEPGTYVVEVEQMEGEESYIERQVIQIKSADKAYTLDTMFLEKTIDKTVIIFFEDKSDLFFENFVWVGQWGSDTIIKVKDGTEVTIFDYDPEESELILFYKDKESGEIFEEYLWGIEPDQKEIYIGDFFEDNYEFDFDEIQECDDYDCEWDEQEEFELCIEETGDEILCEQEVFGLDEVNE